ncbi:MAG TPA: hypothetical protein VIC06_07330 [Solirubrobacteraceae bacterium]|jgi:hypothetical protein
MTIAIINTYYVVKSIHNMAALVTFGVAFVYPIAFAVATRHDPRSLPALHRIESTIERTLIVPGLLVVVLTGIDITSIAHHWGQFFVQWGLSAAVVIGVLVTAVMIPNAERAAALAERDLTASAAGASGAAGVVSLSGEYRALARRLLMLGLLLSAIILITILFMAVGFNP